MEFTTFVRRPFTVEAVEVTKENMNEIAEGVGVIKLDDHGRPFIFIDREKVPNVYSVFPGYWMTKMGDKTRFYSRKAFNNQFMATNEDLEELMSRINGGVAREIPSESDEEETKEGVVQVEEWSGRGR